MTTIKKTGSRQAQATTYQLLVLLSSSNPLIWRRLLVPGNANLGWLHAVLQVAVGWTNSHLHQFKMQGACYSDTRHNFAEFEGDPEILEGQKYRLEQVAPKLGDVLYYEYDFGDGWDHAVLVEDIRPSEPAFAKSAVCVGGARSCPPEDCGGIWGYAELLKALKDRKHPDHQHLKEWVGGAFNAESFESNKTNFWLGKLKWPNVTEAALRNVLMARDGHHPAA